MKRPAVYILTSNRLGTLYVGVTSNLTGRIWDHKNNVADGFTKRYGVHSLHDTMISAIGREKQLKKWRSAWKIDLIEETNPDWCDLYPGLIR